MPDPGGNDVPAPVHHELSVRGRWGTVTFDIQATLAAPWTVLFGPSGSGKSTLLQAMAGLSRGLEVKFLRYPASSSPITLQDRKTSLQPERRALAYTPQQAVLFPHLTVLENVSFAQRVHGKNSASNGEVEEAMALLALDPLANRLPRELSGGERQRVSLARALAVPDPRLVLLDEPFAGIDRALRDDLLPEVQRLLQDRGVPVISVTHDVDETLLLQAEVIRLHAGEVLAQAPAAAVLHDEIARLLQTLQRQPSQGVSAYRHTWGKGVD